MLGITVRDRENIMDQTATTVQDTLIIGLKKRRKWAGHTYKTEDGSWKRKVTH